MLSKMTNHEREAKGGTIYKVGCFCPYLSMPNRRIFDSSVWRGIPSFAGFVHSLGSKQSCRINL